MRLEVFGCLAVGAQCIAWLGLCDQLRTTTAARTTTGLSLADAESRLWGKLPWILFACSATEIDTAVLISNAIGIVFAAAALVQFFRFRAARDRVIEARVILQIVLLGATILSVLLFREELRRISLVVGMMPVITSLLSVSLGACAQFRENRRRVSTEALSMCRYVTLFGSNLLWFAYGMTKGVLIGWHDAWPICTGTGVGAVASAAILVQFFVYRETAAVRDRGYQSGLAVPASALASG